MNILVTGAGGALGGHLVKRLADEGHHVRAVDKKSPEKWWQTQDSRAVDNWPSTDLSNYDYCREAVHDMDRVFNLAANMGGIGFITEKESDCAYTVLTTANMIRAAAAARVERFTETSSACIYPTTMQGEPLSRALREDDAWPAMPDHGYGLEKLYGEKLCEFAARDFGLPVRVARLHNVYGPHGEWRGGREKAPAAICRKVAEAKLSGDYRIDVWGDGKQTRSFCWVGDFVEGIIRISESDCSTPLNLGSSELVTIDGLITLVEMVAKAPESLERRYDPTAPQGVRGRNSDNSKIIATIGWEPSTPLVEGLRQLYPWIEERVRACRR